jgi:hypothetical protein
MAGGGASPGAARWDLGRALARQPWAGGLWRVAPVHSSPLGGSLWRPKKQLAVGERPPIAFSLLVGTVEMP